VPTVALLLPTATYRAADFLAAARELDVDVVVVSERRQALAGSMGDRALVANFDRPDAAAADLVALADRSPLDAVVAVDDQGVIVAALASERLGLRGNPADAVAATRDKARFRRALAAAGVRQPDFHEVGPDDDAGDAATGVGLPCVVKPVALSGSRGVIRVDRASDAGEAASRVRAILESAGEACDGTLLVERFVAGREIAVEGLLRGGTLEVLAVFDKPDPLDGPYFAETIYVTPSRVPPAVLDAAVRAVAAACTACGLVEGPVHAELRIDDGGLPWMLEVAARSIGGHCSRALRFATDTTLEELILRHALGLPVDTLLQRETAAAGVLMLPVETAGTLAGVHGVEEAKAVEGITDVEISIPPGRDVQPLPEGDRYLGFVLAKAPTPQLVEAALREAWAHVKIEVS
jgi:biotin carboxylase